MKYVGAVVLVWVLIVAPLAVQAARHESRVEYLILRDCDPVCEVQAQDSAFSLLIEAYRQFQSYQIEQDFQARLRAAAGLNERENGTLIIDTHSQALQTLRAWVEELARKERELRFEQLHERVANFHTAYNCARRLDEDEVGFPVANRVDTRSAANEIRSYNIIALGSATTPLRTVKASPASSIFFDAPPADVPSERLIAPCE
jgi:hypothetical protein